MGTRRGVGTRIKMGTRMETGVGCSGQPDSSSRGNSPLVQLGRLGERSPRGQDKLLVRGVGKESPGAHSAMGA